MTEQQTVFLAKSKIKASDLEHKRKVSFNIQKYNDSVVKGKQQFANLDVARQKAKNHGRLYCRYARKRIPAR
jgi:L-lactate dehydrogenase complex protein LldF